MAAKCNDPANPLSKDTSFRFQFKENAAAILRTVCGESMPLLADSYAKSPGRETIARALEALGAHCVPRLEGWLEHESPQVRSEAL